VEMTLLEWLAKIGGPLLVILAVFAIAVWRALTWMGVNIMVPLKDRAIKHVDHLDATLTRLADNDARQTELLEKLTDDMTSVRNGMHRVGCPVIAAMPNRRPPESNAP